MPSPIQLPSPLPVLESDRLRLRPLAPSDAGAIFEHFHNPQVAAGHGIVPWDDPSKGEAYIRWYAQALSNSEACRWVITPIEQDRLIGSIGLHQISPEHYRGEIGYDLQPAFWRQGLATEAVRAVLQICFTQIGFHRIEAIVDPDNAASAALLKKVGFQFEGDLRERFFDGERFVADRFYGLLKEEF